MSFDLNKNLNDNLILVDTNIDRNNETILTSNGNVTIVVIDDDRLKLNKDNKIKVLAPDYSLLHLQISCSGCSKFSKDGEHYIARALPGVKKIGIKVTNKKEKLIKQYFELEN